MKREERKARNEGIVSRVRDGRSFGEVAAEFGISAQQVRNIATEAGVHVPRRRPEKEGLRERNELIVSRIEAGESVADIASDLGLSGQYVRALAVRGGATPPDCRHLSHEGLRKRNELIADRVRGGESVADIAADLGLSEQYVRVLAIRGGATPPDCRHRSHEGLRERNELIADRVREGHTLQEVAEEFGLSSQTIRKVATKAGAYEGPGRMRTPQGRNEEILELLRQGSTFMDVGRRYGLTRERIRQIAKTYGEDDIWERKLRSQRQAKDEREGRIVQDAAKRGIPSTQIAEEHGHSATYWEKAARRHGVRIVGSNGRPIRDGAETVAARDARICEYLREGHTQVETAERFGLRQTNICRIALKNGIRRKSDQGTLEDRNRRIVDQLREGASVRDVAGEFGLTEVWVRNIAIEGGIEPRQLRVRLTDEERAARNERILGLVREGHTDEQVGEMLGITGATVANVVKAIGEDGIRETQRHARKEGRRRVVEDAVERGLTSEQVAEEHGCTPGYWRKAAREDGMSLRDMGKLRPRGEALSERNARICARLREGHTQKEVAKEFGLSQTRIDDIAHANGIHTRSERAAAREERNRAILDQVASGVSYGEVAERAGVSLQTVYRVVARGRGRA